MLFSQGSRFGGHALYVRDGKLAYAYNFVGEAVQVVGSSELVPTGHVTLSASFERAGDAMPPQGTLSLHIRDQLVGEGRIMTQPGKFGLGGGGLVVGRSGAEPVTDDYPGQRPWAFTGGAIRRVVIDVSGQTTYTDFIGIVSGRSDRQVEAIAENVVLALKAIDFRLVGREGSGNGRAYAAASARHDHALVFQVGIARVWPHALSPCRDSR